MNPLCKFCRLVRRPGVPCLNSEFIRPSVERLARLPGIDPNMKRLARLPRGEDSVDNCPDCGTPPGGFHHADCTMEICPGCGGYRCMCSCVLVVAAVQRRPRRPVLTKSAKNNLLVLAMFAESQAAMHDVRNLQHSETLDAVDAGVEFINHLVAWHNTIRAIDGAIKSRKEVR